MRGRSPLEETHHTDCQYVVLRPKKVVFLLDYNVMPLTKKKKNQIVDELADKLSTAKTLIFTHFTKVSVEKIKELRKSLRASGSDFKVTKKSLLGVALKKSNLSAEGIDLKKAGDAMGVAFSQDQIKPARSVVMFGKAKGNETFKVLGGLFDGQMVVSTQIATLAKSASKEELYSRLLGQMKAPLSRLAYALKAVGEKQQAEGK